MPRRYVVISPCRDEAKHLQATIDSLAAQTIPPTTWLIIDDGSTDETPQLLEEACRKHAFVQVVRREGRRERSVGPGVIDAFYYGLSCVDLAKYDYLCKLDCDLELGPRYFERAFERFEQDPWLGTLSGKLELRINGRRTPERIGDENSVGAAKLYRVECFQDIGGFVRGVCWDGIDGHMCRLKGWVAASVDDPEMLIGHLRQMGSSHRGVWHGRVRWGSGKYFMGSSLPYVAAVGLYRAFERPFVIGGLGILVGYLSSLLRRAPRVEDRAYRRGLRAFETMTLFMGRRKALQRINQRLRRGVPPSSGRR